MTTRRVTAQRKFAQGAYVPPTNTAAAAAAQVAAAAAPQPPQAAAAHERRESAFHPEDHRSSVVNGTITNILDTICFSNSHNHVQPIVLVEKLDTTTDNNSVASSLRITEKRPLKKRIKRKRRVATGINKKSVHVMSLRSIAQRRSLVKYSPLPGQQIRLKFNGKNSPDKIVKPLKRKSSRREVREITTSEFSVDDNRPLTYFAKCSTPNAPNASMTPDMSDAPDTNESPKKPSPPISTSDVFESMPPPQSRVVNRPKRPESTTTCTSSIIPLVHLIPKRVEIIERGARQIIRIRNKNETRLRPLGKGKGERKVKVIDNNKDKVKVKGKVKSKVKGKAKVEPKPNAKLHTVAMVAEKPKNATRKSERTSVPEVVQSKTEGSPMIHESYSVKTGTALSKKSIQRRKSCMRKATSATIDETHTSENQENEKQRDDSSPVNYYSEQRICRWIAGAHTQQMALNEPGPSRQPETTDVFKGPPTQITSTSSAPIIAPTPAARSAITRDPIPTASSAPALESTSAIPHVPTAGLTPVSTAVPTPVPTPTPVPSTSAQDLQLPTMEYDDDEDFVLHWDTDDCPAIAWTTLQDVADAAKADFDRRCAECKNCERIEKLMKITNLLKQQMRIDCLNDEKNKGNDNSWENVCAPGQSHSRSQDEKTRARPDEIQTLYLELIPSNKHLVMIVEKWSHNKQVFSASFTPRSEINHSPTLILSENDELFDHLIETLSLNIGEGPSNLVRKLRSPHRANSPVFSTAGPPESCIDMDDIMSSYSGTGTANAAPGPSTSRRKEKVKIPHAPIFYPTKEEFVDPINYIEKIWDEVVKYGICKIVPPDGFEPPCKADDEIRFEVSNQYISRLYCRWGAAAREFCAIKMCLKAQNININRPPLLDGVEVNLPKLYHLVQRHGGLETVSNKKRWGKVAEDMNLVKNPFTERKLDQIYVKYLLPYATLSEDERVEYLRRVEMAWSKKHRKLLERASKPLHRKRRLLCETDSSAEETGEDETDDTEDCVKPGSIMNLAKFKKVARSTYNNFFRGKNVSTRQVEVEYWRNMMIGSEHVCVNSASIDTGEQGLGFSKSRSDSYSKHPWNLKMLSENPSNVLRAMGPVLGVTVPTLHLGMLFSTSCWHRDPHAIAWVEYEHNGPVKLWYGIPESKDKNFRRAMECLSPTSCQNKLLWLSSDISMIPPYLLLERNVEMYRVEQNPGEFVLVMPNAYTCSISTGFTISESTYFATESWLDSVLSVFQEIRDSCEPTMFSLEKLLKDLVEDPRTTPSQLEKIRPAVIKIFEEELENRRILLSKGIRIGSKADQEPSTSKGKKPKIPTPTTSPVWNVRDQDECEVCRCTLYLSKVKNIPSRNVMVCLEHAIKLLEKGNCQLPVSEVELHCEFSNQELQETIDTIRRRLDIE